VGRRARYALPLAATLAVIGAGRAVFAEAPPAPPAPRLWHAPTGWLMPHGAGAGAVGVSHEGHPFVELVAGLGGVAEVGVALTDDFVACTECDGRDDTQAATATALFKLGVAPGTWTRWQPGVALGFRRSFLTFGDARPEVARLYLAASAPLGPLRLHAGGDLWDAAGATPRPPLFATAPAAGRLRPFGGVEYRPGAYPRSTLVADLTWVPTLGADEIGLRWLAALGVRYQALSWGGVELAVRAREGAGLGGAVVLVRLTATATFADLTALLEP
jgi:hypothetical protein